MGLTRQPSGQSYVEKAKSGPALNSDFVVGMKTNVLELLSVLGG